MTAPVDFTNCERLPGRAYNGANGKKIAIRYDGAVWLVKFPPSAADRPTALSYTNSCICEHLASTIADMVGLRSHETRLGTFANGKIKTVCACRDFTADGKQLYDFCSIKTAAALKQDGKKIAYVDFVKRNRDGVLAPSLARIVPRIDMRAISAFIDSAPLLTDLQRRFYKTYLAARHEALFGLQPRRAPREKWRLTK